MDVLQHAHTATPRLSSDEARLLTALPCLAFLTDSTGVICAITPFALRSLGYSSEEILGRATPLLFLDLERIRQRAQQMSRRFDRPVAAGLEALTCRVQPEASESLECELIVKSGQRIMVELTVARSPDAPGEPGGYIYTATPRTGSRQPPITDFMDFLENATDMAQSLAPDGHFLYVNRAWLTTLGYQVDDLPQLTLFDILHPEHLSHAAALFKQSLRGQRQHKMEFVLLTRQGKQVIVESSNTFSFEGENLISVQSILHDITDRKHQEQLVAEQQRQLANANVQLALLATTDALTGLKNRRVFDERMDYECERAIRQQAPVSLVLLDVDHFKEYNDAFGHPAGDAVLQEISLVLLKHTRSIDCVVRYGGEEFAMILPNTPTEGAYAVAERCRQAIEQHRWTVRPITASFGVASQFPIGPGAQTNLLQSADNALYKAKSDGRNCVR